LKLTQNLKELTDDFYEFLFRTWGATSSDLDT